MWKERLDKMEIDGGDIKFQNYWTQINNKNLDFSTTKQLGEYFIQHVGNFRKASEQIIMKIVDKLHDPSKDNDSIRELDEKTVFGLSQYADEDTMNSQVMFFHSKE